VNRGSRSWIRKRFPEQFLVNTAVLCELVWVLGTAYDYSREEIAGTLDQMFATAQFDIERLDDARRALSEFRTTKADFSDALIGRINRSLGAQYTVTFDRDLKGVDQRSVILTNARSVSARLPRAVRPQVSCTPLIEGLRAKLGLPR
jgi:predicted nucleic-acid-binding protein